MKVSRISLTVTVAGLLACGGGGGGSPTEPVLSVSGLWVVTSQLLQNTCPIELPNTVVTDVTFTQNGVQLTAVSEGVTYTGTIDTRTGDFTITASGSLGGGVSFVDVVSGRFSSNSQFTSESQATLTDGVDSCVIRTSDDGRRQ